MKILLIIMVVLLVGLTAVFCVCSCILSSICDEQMYNDINEYIDAIERDRLKPVEKRDDNEKNKKKI